MLLSLNNSVITFFYVNTETVSFKVNWRQILFIYWNEPGVSVCGCFFSMVLTIYQGNVNELRVNFICYSRAKLGNLPILQNIFVQAKTQNNVKMLLRAEENCRLGYNSLWVCYYERPLLHCTVIGSIVNKKKLIGAALNWWNEY